MNKAEYEDRYGRIEPECEHEWQDEIICGFCGNTVNKDDLELEYCPFCFGDMDEFYHECKWCGERNPHEKYLETIN